jgi:hypothetical protein
LRVPAAAPTIDDRLLRFIHGSPPDDSPAELTRAAGELAWRLGLVRPCYETVRLIAQLREPARPRITAATLVKVIDTLYEYPAPLLGNAYDRYRRGEL